MSFAPSEVYSVIIREIILIIPKFEISFNHQTQGFEHRQGEKGKSAWADMNKGMPIVLYMVYFMYLNFYSRPD